MDQRPVSDIMKRIDTRLLLHLLKTLLHRIDMDAQRPGAHLRTHIMDRHRHHKRAYDIGLFNADLKVPDHILLFPDVKL